MNVLVVPDKFKGTLTARAAADAIARGWRKARPHDRLVTLPMSDGGDGFGEVMGELLGAKRQTIRTVDAAHRRCKSRWWWQAKTKTAVIESATVIGLAMLPPGRFHPFQLDTFGLGKALNAAARKGARRVIIGIGGSATNDGGFGLARALGWQFLDDCGNAILKWTDLEKLDSIRTTTRPRIEIIIASDVQNPLLGPRGASRVYGPQKGLRSRDFVIAEACLKQLAAIVRRQFKQDFAKIPGAGAAGGLGFGLSAFLGAEFRSGFDLFADKSKLSRQLRQADVVITGEGMIDRSSLMGKGAGEVARRSRSQQLPCIALAGCVSDKAALNRRFIQVHALTDLTTAANAKARPALWLERLAEFVAAQAKA